MRVIAHYLGLFSITYAVVPNETMLFVIAHYLGLFSITKMNYAIKMSLKTVIAHYLGLFSITHFRKS